MKKLGWLTGVVGFIVLISFIFSMPEGNSAKGASPLVFKSCKDRPPPPRPPMRTLRNGMPMPKASAPAGQGITAGAPPPAPRVEAKKMEEAPLAKFKADGARKEGIEDIHQAGKKVSKEIQRAQELYLSNDDSMSLASAQRIFYVIDNFLPLYRDQVRPHELLNYFHFKTLPVVEGKTFSVAAEMAPREKGESLAFAVQGKSMTAEGRSPAVLTLIIDRSGSMAAAGKMEYLKLGLETLKQQLKRGDVLNVVEFDHELCSPMESYEVGRDSTRYYDQTVSELFPRGSTDLHKGLVEGYRLAEKYYDPDKINRVILITDAIANTGELSPELMASIGRYYDTKKIALSGIGVGMDFNDTLLDELTDRGKGAYLFLGTKEAAQRVFGKDFLSLLETVARDVRFKVIFPKGVHLEQFYGEEVSTTAEKIQPIHYFVNTSQLFLLDLLGKAEPQESVRFEITYKNPENDSDQKQEESFPVASISQGRHENIQKGRMLMAFADLLEKTAVPGSAPRYNYWERSQNRESFRSEKSRKICDDGQRKMKTLTEGYSDEEVKQVLDLAAKYCSRY